MLKLTELEQSRLENIALKQQILLHQKQALLIMVGTRLEIDISKYLVDPQTGVVSPMVVPTHASPAQTLEMQPIPHAETTVVKNK